MLQKKSRGERGSKMLFYHDGDVHKITQSNHDQPGKPSDAQA